MHVTETVWVCDYESDSCWEEVQDLQYAEVTFVLPEGSPSNDLSVDPRFTNWDGIATFGPEEGSENPLSIGTANDPSTTDYRLVPVATFEDDYEHGDDDRTRMSQRRGRRPTPSTSGTTGVTARAAA